MGLRLVLFSCLFVLNDMGSWDLMIGLHQLEILEFKSFHSIIQNNKVTIFNYLDKQVLLFITWM